MGSERVKAGEGYEREVEQEVVAWCDGWWKAAGETSVGGMWVAGAPRAARAARVLAKDFARPLEAVAVGVRKADEAALFIALGASPERRRNQ